jgi:broad specificity phosphatase PhoE
MAGDIWLIRHGETAWSLSGAHTGRSDIPLTPEGENKARGIGKRLAGRQFALVLTSPLQRARRTCELAGYGTVGQIEPNLAEWDYGEYEGRTSQEIRRNVQGWTIFRDGVPGGETITQVAARAQLVIGRALGTDGDVALFAHGHVLRILATCWLGIEPQSARLLALGTAGISTLGYEHETRVIVHWNQQ